MSQYKISKARLKEIIKEEYEAAMTRTDEGHGAFGIANRDEKSETEEEKEDEKVDEAHCGSANRDEDNKKPDEDGDGVPDWADKKPGKDDHAEKDGDKKEKDLSKVPPQLRKHMEKKMKKESLDSIRALIQQELKNL